MTDERFSECEDLIAGGASPPDALVNILLVFFQCSRMGKLLVTVTTRPLESLVVNLFVTPQTLSMRVLLPTDSTNVIGSSVL